MPEDNRWRRGKIKGSFNEQGADRRADKPGLSREFNKQDRRRIAESKLERLSSQYTKLADRLNQPEKRSAQLKPQGKMRAARNAVDRNEKMRKRSKIQTRMKAIKKQIKEQEKALKRDRER